MSNNKENNIKLHGIITKFFNDVKTKFTGYYTKTEADPFRTVKDLTHLTTQDELYNAINGVLGNYLIKKGTIPIIWNVGQANATYVRGTTRLYGGGSVTQNLYAIASKGSSAAISTSLSPTQVGTPTHDSEAATKKYVDDNAGGGIPADYEEKEITITPAVYGWKTITDYATKHYTLEDIGKKVRITNITVGVSSGLISATQDTKLPQINIHLGTDYTDSGEQGQLFYSSEFPTKVGYIKFKTTPAISIGESNYPISKFEIWDIITPAVKATVLVKK